MKNPRRATGGGFLVTIVERAHVRADLVAVVAEAMVVALALERHPAAHAGALARPSPGAPHGSRRGFARAAKPRREDPETFEAVEPGAGPRPAVSERFCVTRRLQT